MGTETAQVIANVNVLCKTNTHVLLTAKRKHLLKHFSLVVCSHKGDQKAFQIFSPLVTTLIYKKKIIQWSERGNDVINA